MKKQSLKIILTVIWLLAAGICYSCSHVPSHSTDSEWKLELSDDPEDTQEETTSDDRTESDPAVLYVYVCGEIQNPGVWELRPGDRIFRAIEMAGGVTEDAAVDSLNLAAEVTDGMKLWVPSREEMKALGEKNGDSAVFTKDGWSGNGGRYFRRKGESQCGNAGTADDFKRNRGSQSQGYHRLSGKTW